MRLSMKLVILFFLSLSLIFANENLFKALPLNGDIMTEKEKLGKLLFHDPILSQDQTVSCATCHPLLNYGVDNLPKSFGVNGAIGNRNTPTVWNARYNISQFWDGRAKDLKEQALMPITNPVEMNETLESVLQKLKKNQPYNKKFEMLYKDGVTTDNLADALASFEETLVSSGSKFDKYLQGDYKALNAQEKRGLELFKKKGCVACHNGINIGGTLYQRIGMFGSHDALDDTDLGRYGFTKKIFDKRTFKVPSLRNVEKTAPYFHNGSISTLKEAVEIMVELQLGRDLNDNDINNIVLFLNTLTGQVHD